MPYKSKKERKRCDAISRQKRVAKQRDQIIKLLGGKCKVCSFDDVRALDVDHKFGGGTKERKKIGGGYYSFILKKIKSGSKAYQVLCCNHNRIKVVTNNEKRKTIHLK